MTRESAAAPTGSSRPEFRRDLGLFDFVLLVVGAVIGADVYIVGGLGSRQLGPAQLVAWIVAGILAALISLAFVQCSLIIPRVGGSYAYARQAFGPLAGFLVGWALYIGEWIALPIFPITFAKYLGYFLPTANGLGRALASISLVGLVTATNWLGVRRGSRLNDFLTIAKLAPLAALIAITLAALVTHPDSMGANFTPFAPVGWGGFGSAVVLIFWAYAGFELAVLPANEVREPRRVLPTGLVVGMIIASAFYLLTAISLVAALTWTMAANSPRPLADALNASLATFGVSHRWGEILMSVGAAVSIIGVYDVFTLGVARLSYALASDGLLPRPFAHLNSPWGTPSVGLAFEAASAIGLSLLFNLSDLISVSVFFLGICYLGTALAAIRLIQQQPGYRLRVQGLRVILVLAAVSGAYLSSQVSHHELLGGVLAMGVGLGWYALRPQVAAFERTPRFVQAERRLEHLLAAGEHWLWRFVRRERMGL